MTKFIEEIKHTVALQSRGPILVHSDVFRARVGISENSKPALMLEAHITALEFAVDHRQLVFPVFNYDFPKTKIYDVDSSLSQVGPLTEYARKNWATWRHGPPIFNFCGRGDYSYPCAEEGFVDPFGEESLFGHLRTNKGIVLMYGAPFSSFTSIHYIERYAGGPLYRYDKQFSGIIRKGGGVNANVTLNYHCRPLGKSLDYDWQRLQDDATREGIIKKIQVAGGVALVIPFYQLSEYWVSELKDDPLYLLDYPSRKWVEPMLQQLGRRFYMSDFESV